MPGKLDEIVELKPHSSSSQSYVIEDPMTNLKEALLDDANAFYARNGASLERPDDPILKILSRVHRASPLSNVLEVGCSNGWRLDAIRATYNAQCTGIDASSDAVAVGGDRFPELRLWQGLAPECLEKLLDEPQFDCIILGFFTYLLPRSEIFHLASLTDRLLAEEGHLIVFDFLYPTSIRTNYSHSELLTTFKSDPSAPWTWSPTYTLVERSVYQDDLPESFLKDPKSWGTVDVLKKNAITDAYPELGSVKFPATMAHHPHQ